MSRSTMRGAGRPISIAAILRRAGADADPTARACASSARGSASRSRTGRGRPMRRMRVAIDARQRLGAARRPQQRQRNQRSQQRGGEQRDARDAGAGRQVEPQAEPGGCEEKVRRPCSAQASGGQMRSHSSARPARRARRLSALASLRARVGLRERRRPAFWRLRSRHSPRRPSHAYPALHRRPHDRPPSTASRQPRRNFVQGRSNPRTSGGGAPPRIRAPLTRTSGTSRREL